jgi:esterase/lipase superfamily enzyme
MDKQLTAWHSPALNKEMPLAMYGNYGFALLLIPTAAADYLEYERFQLIDSISQFINVGKVKVFSVNSINTESWMNNNMHPRDKAIRHQQFNQYIFEEVIPFIKTNTSNETPIIISGASFGALHSANLFFKRPDLLHGFIAMSGVYDLTAYTKGYFDEDVYFNSPAHYLPNLTDHNILQQIRRSQHLHMLTGSGAHEDPDVARSLGGILYNKGINYELDVWGHDMAHDWPTWRAMLPHYLGTRF